jgi:hypothetical protein
VKRRNASDAGPNAAVPSMARRAAVLTASTVGVAVLLLQVLEDPLNGQPQLELIYDRVLAELRMVAGDE